MSEASQGALTAELPRLPIQKMSMVCILISLVVKTNIEVPDPVRLRQALSFESLSYVKPRTSKNDTDNERYFVVYLIIGVLMKLF